MVPDGFTFGLDLGPGMAWDTYLKTLGEQRAGVNLPADRVPAAFLVADVAGEIVGRASIRYSLNDFLAREGGHIGYCVLPAHRRRGYATEILRQSLIIARANGVGRVLVICDEDNAGSRGAIETCGGQLESIAGIAASAPRIRRYWIG
jgi:predicted acetyltransferase